MATQKDRDMRTERIALGMALAIGAGSALCANSPAQM
jgi:hypothetical protein